MFTALKRILPYISYTITTHIEEDEVWNRISDEFGTSSGSYALVSGLKQFSREGNTFKIIGRGITHRNDFRPVTIGRVYNHSGITHIDMQIRPTIAISIFMVIWTSATGILALSTILTLLKNISRHALLSFQDIAPVAPFILGTSLFLFSFHIDVSSSRKFFANLFDADLKEK